MSEWQPIETAPRDCFAKILVSNGEEVECAYYVRYDHWKTGEYEIRYNSYQDGETPLFFIPTHWQPLPEPPHKETEK